LGQPDSTVWYPNTEKRTVYELLPFAATYTCKTGLSHYAATKTKSRNNLNPASNMRFTIIATK
jgi:hypothetical protein